MFICTPCVDRLKKVNLSILFLKNIKTGKLGYKCYTTVIYETKVITRVATFNIEIFITDRITEKFVLNVTHIYVIFLKI